MRRIVVILSAAALMAAITMFSSVSVFAQEGCTDEPPGTGGMGIWTQTCELGTEVRSEEVSRTPTTQTCEVGMSGREGTQEGDDVITDQVTYRIYTTQRFTGNPSNGNEIDLEPIEHEEEVPDSRVEGEPTFEPTGPCKPLHPGGRPV